MVRLRGLAKHLEVIGDQAGALAARHIAELPGFLDSEIVPKGGRA